MFSAQVNPATSRAVKATLFCRARIVKATDKCREDQIGMERAELRATPECSWHTRVITCVNVNTSRAR